jgi:predicted DNA-binding protein (UPF0251 family)
MQFALTLDQRSSRDREDIVRLWMDIFNVEKKYKLARKFERTSGDEMQALVDDPATAIDIVLDAIESKQWWIGLGVGEVHHPIPSSVRETSGEALENARLAVDRAKLKTERHRFVVIGDDPKIEDLSTVLALVALIIERRSSLAKEAARVNSLNLSQNEAAKMLRISQQSYSERLSRAAVPEQLAGRRLAIKIATALLDQ